MNTIQPIAISPLILTRILSYLFNNPGEFQWWRLSTIWNVEIVKLHIHLQWLQKHGFIENTEGKSYRTEKRISEIDALLTPKPKPQPAPILKAKQAKPKSQPKVKRTRTQRQSRPKRPPTQLPQETALCRQIALLDFDRATAWDVANLLRQKTGKFHDLATLDRVLREMPMCRVERLKGKNYPVFSNQCNAQLCVTEKPTETRSAIG